MIYKTAEEAWSDRWADIVLNEDGSINLEQVKKELSDYSFLLDQVPRVYAHVTNNKISKPNTHAYEVMVLADDEVTELFEQECIECRKGKVDEQ